MRWGNREIHPSVQTKKTSRIIFGTERVGKEIHYPQESCHFCCNPALFFRSGELVGGSIRGTFVCVFFLGASGLRNDVVGCGVDLEVFLELAEEGDGFLSLVLARV